MSGNLRIAFAGGGTGGHLYPAINLAKTFENKFACEIIFFGTSYGIEAKKIPALGYKLELLNVRGLQRRISVQNLLFLYRLSASFLKARKILKTFKPHVVIGTGGYVMGPVMKMAIHLKIATIIQEQNSYPGITTRMLSKDMDCVFLAYKQAADFLNINTKYIVAPNPVIKKMSEKTSHEIYKEFALDPDLKTILIFGGSQGAASINNAIRAVIEQEKLPAGTQLLWQCGPLQFEKYDSWLKSSGVKNITLTPFIEDMGMAYKITDLCICRAGAMSISELEQAEVPSILIPLKSAAANHQFKNARVSELKGCAKLIEDNGLLVHRLIEQINIFMDQPKKLDLMKKNLANLVKKDGGEIITSAICNILKEKNIWPE